jgi:hypothetical protein
LLFRVTRSGSCDLASLLPLADQDAGATLSTQTLVRALSVRTLVRLSLTNSAHVNVHAIDAYRDVEASVDEAADELHDARTVYICRHLHELRRCTLRGRGRLRR